MSWKLCTSGAAIHEAGELADETITTSGAALADYSNNAEGEICTLARYDVVTNWDSLTTNGKAILSNMAAVKIAQKIVKWRQGGYTSRFTSTQILNVLENEWNNGAKLLKDDNYKTYLGMT